MSGTLGESENDRSYSAPGEFVRCREFTTLIGLHKFTGLQRCLDVQKMFRYVPHIANLTDTKTSHAFELIHLTLEPTASVCRWHALSAPSVVITASRTIIWHA